MQFYRHFNKCIAQLVIILLLGCHQLLAAKLSDSQAESLYRQGLAHRNAGRIFEAINCFKPLADQGHIRAQHNLAMRYLDIDQPDLAYHYFRRSQDQGFEQSARNIARMNTLFLLLSKDTLKYVASKLTMRDLLTFKQVSKQAYKIVDDLVTSVDYLNSELPFTSYIRHSFRQVIFDPQPTSIRLNRCLQTHAYDSDVYIQFRDTDHLRKIVTHTPLVDVKNLYFIQNDQVEDGQEIYSPHEKLKKSYYINISGNGPLTLKGRLQFPGIRLRLPENSDHSQLYLYRQLDLPDCEICKLNFDTHKNGHSLADMIDNSDQQLFKLRTEEAKNLIDSWQAAYCNDNAKAELVSNFKELCQNFVMLSTSDITVSHKSYIDTEGTLIYMAKDVDQIKKLRNDIPEFTPEINFINPSCQINSAIYCKEPIFLRQGYTILTQGDLALIGTLQADQYYITLYTSKSIWNFEAKLILHSIKTYVGCHSRSYTFHPWMKPTDMPLQLWNNLLKMYRNTIKQRKQNRQQLISSTDTSATNDKYP